MATVERLTDRAEIRKRLNADRVWSIYALADLDDQMFQLCEWWGIGDGVSLIFTGIAIRPVFVQGNEREVRALLEHLPADWGYLNLRDHHKVAADGLYEYLTPHRMKRMVAERFEPPDTPQETVELGPAQLGEVQRLYSTGDGGGVAFGAFQLDTGFFRGVRRGGELVAVAGVHAVSLGESVAGVGNVFTRTDCRGQGLAQQTTAAVVASLVASGIKTIGLNVEQDNLPAIAAYQRLGFRTAFEYWEGTASRMQKTG